MMERLLEMSKPEDNVPRPQALRALGRAMERHALKDGDLGLLRAGREAQAKAAEALSSPTPPHLGPLSPRKP